MQGVPQAGDTLQVVADVERAQDIAQQRQMQARQAAMLKTTKRGIESLGQAEIKELLVILKADVQGSVEVLRGTLEKLSTEKVKVRVIRAGVGAINESDVLLASATQTEETGTAVVIIGFNVRPEARVAAGESLEGPRFGVPDYVPKTFTPQTLLEKVEKCLHTVGLTETAGASAFGAAPKAPRETELWNPREVVLEGRIDFVGMPAVLEMFHFNQLSGVCAVRSGDQLSAEVGFEDGEIAHVPPDDVAFSLVAGACYHRAFVLSETLSPSFQRAAVEFAVNGLLAHPTR